MRACHLGDNQILCNFVCGAPPQTRLNCELWVFSLGFPTVSVGMCIALKEDERRSHWAVGMRHGHCTGKKAQAPRAL